MTYEQEPQTKSGYGFYEWYADLKAQQTQRQLADVKRGLFRREDKIHLLEGLLYNRVQDGEPVDDLVIAIEVLQANKVQDDLIYNSAVAQVNGVIAFVISIGITATVVSYLSMPLCRGSQSKFCVGSRVIPGYVADIFREPARVLPINTKVD